MQVEKMMNQHPACCASSSTIEDVAKMMVEQHCGSIPVVDGQTTSRHLLGIVTDRDIVCRVVAEGKDPRRTTAKDCMSTPVITVRPTDSVEECFDVMDRYQIRRIPVVDDHGDCLGIVTQAHMAKNLPEEKTGQLLKDISQKSDEASRVALAR